MCMKYEDSDFIKKFIDSSFSSNLSSLSLYKNLGKMTADALWLNIRWQKIFNNVLWKKIFVSTQLIYLITIIIKDAMLILVQITKGWDKFPNFISESFSA